MKSSAIMRPFRLLVITSSMLIMLMLTMNEWAHRSDTVHLKDPHYPWSADQQQMLLERPINVSLPTTPTPAISSLIHTFGSVQDEVLYMYHKYILTKWTPNVDKVKLLRKEFFAISNATSSDQLVLTKGNTHTDVAIPLYGPSKKQNFFKPTNSLLKYLPRNPVFFNGTVYDKCSVVGNSGILLRSGCGTEIDSADYVFRCNLVPIKKFGVDAGFKTNLTTMNPSIISSRYKNFQLKVELTRFGKALEEYTGYLFLPCLSQSPLLNVCIKKVLPAIRMKIPNSRNGTRLKMVVGNSRHLMGIKKLWEAQGIRYMSTGFYLAQTALTICDEVHLFGFWPFNRSILPNYRTYKYHFFDSMAQSKAHKFSQEFQILWQQHRQGILRLHTQDCD